MDADDKCVKERIEKQVEFLETHEEYSLVASRAYVHNGTKIVGIRGKSGRPNEADIIYGPIFMHPTIMMRRSIYRKLDGYTVANRTIRGQDWDLWFRFVAANYQGFILEEPLLIYHESKTDYKKRTLKTAIMYTQTALYGYKLLKIPFYKYIYAFKPIITALIPNKILELYHK